MKITILSLFPEYFAPLIKESVIGRAYKNGLFEFEVVNFRDYTLEKHGHVDDTPFGGGAGQVLMCQPILDALKAVRQENSKVILLSPQGKTFNQSMAFDLSKEAHLIFICGHYEGFDERIRDYVDLQISLGDFVLTGGEPACMVMCDAIIRLLNGTIKKQSSEDDSFSDGLLEYPQYTKPREYDGKLVPEVLWSGNHAHIAKWRHEMALKNTSKYRPDLLEKKELSKEDQKIVDSILKSKDE